MITGLNGDRPECTGDPPMNDPQTHFVAVCPHCSTTLRIRRVLAGQLVRCKHCEKTFVAEETDAPDTKGSDEATAQPTPPPSPEERIVVTCPSCQTTLSVRRVYIGRHVRCKRCDETFLISEPTAADQPSPTGQHDQPETDGPPEGLQAEFNRRIQELQVAHDKLQADLDRARSVQAQGDRLETANQELEAANARLQAEVDRLSSERQRLGDEHNTLQASQAESISEAQQLRSTLDRIRPEHDQLLHDLEHANIELEAIRADLGGIAPAEVGTLAEERAALTAEADRLRVEIQVLRDEQTARDRSAVERERQWDADVNAAHAEVDRLAGRLQQCEAELESARAERDHLGIEGQRALEETEGARAALAEREHLMQAERDRLEDEVDQVRTEGDRLRSELESLQRGLADAERSRQEGIGALETQLAELAEQHRQAQEQHRAAERACREHEERNQDLQADLDRLHSSQPAPPSSDDLEAARAEIASLKQQLNDSERLQREMAALLAGIGIRYREV
jgi:predicted Zn finger-like uncharacterized protein